MIRKRIATKENNEKKTGGKIKITQKELTVNSYDLLSHEFRTINHKEIHKSIYQLKLAD